MVALKKEKMGCIFIYSCFARQIFFQIEKFEFDLKRNSSGRT